MTNKTIIDGIDVSKCSNYDEEQFFECEQSYCHCEELPNCYFKQLARAKQEIEKLLVKDEKCCGMYNKANIENISLEQQVKDQALEIEKLKKGVLLSPKFSIENGVAYYTITQGEYEKLKKNCPKRCKADKYKQALVDIKKYQQRNCETCVFANTQKCNINCQVFVILAIIESAKDGE